MKLYVEIIPDVWPDWRSEPWGWRVGRTRKTRPIDVPTAGYWKEIDLMADASEMFWRVRA